MTKQCVSGYDHLIKILLIGDSGVGKSSIMNRYCNGTFDLGMYQTIGVDFMIKEVIIDNKICKIQIWDTSGQERFRTITSSYYRGVDGIFCVFDINNPNSFYNLNDWVNDISNYVYDEVCISLMGNKCEKIPKIVNSDDISNFCEKNDLDYYEVSAKNNTNIENAFSSFLNVVYENRVKNRVILPTKTLSADMHQSIDKKSFKRCCF